MVNDTTANDHQLSWYWQPLLHVSPCYFSPLAEIPGPKEWLENSLTFEEFSGEKYTVCMVINLLTQLHW